MEFIVKSNSFNDGGGSCGYCQTIYLLVSAWSLCTGLIINIYIDNRFII
ncbi:hypothetical protein [Alkaliphilus sp. B6464]|nr:hypothetical protein [Alkaliphilus sp. B6464]QUH18788.1 hypothetical protein HYG84_01920 [Alkaliphilus sp. B6464]